MPVVFPSPQQPTSRFATTNLPDGPMRKTFRDCARSPEYICMLHFSRVFIRCRKFAVSEPRLAVVASSWSCKFVAKALRPLYAILLWDFCVSFKSSNMKDK